MDTTAISPATPVSQIQPQKSTQKEISSDFETFLKMLTVQLQNQDPLNPIESSDYAVQLATFSGVEQQVQTNDLLKDMIAQMGAGGMAQLAGWVGKEVRTSAAVSFVGSPITLSTIPSMSAESAMLVVSDIGGTEMQRIPIDPRETEVLWAGVTDDGAPLPNGEYSFQLIASALGQEISRTPASTYARVTEVQSVGGQTRLIMDSGATASIDEVTAVREAF